MHHDTRTPTPASPLDAVGSERTNDGVIEFEDGAVLDVSSGHGLVHLTARHDDGHGIAVTFTAREAREHADALENGTGDALWTMDPARARDTAQTLREAARRASDDNPEADSRDDVVHESHARVALDGGHADVDVFTDRIEVTVRLGDRTVLGIALSHVEAANLGRAISSPTGATTGDLFHLADTLGVNAGDILRLRETAHA